MKVFASVAALAAASFLAVWIARGEHEAAPPSHGAHAGTQLTVDPSQLVPLDDIRVRIEAGELDLARAALAARLTVDEDDGPSLVLASRAARLAGDLDAALEQGERAAELLPEESEAHLVHARALGMKMQEGGMLAAMGSLGDFKDALARAIELDPHNVEAITDQIAFYLIAPGFVGGDVEQAIELAEGLVGTDRVRGTEMLVWALTQDEQPERAREVLDAALAEEPDHPDLNVALAGILRVEERWQESDEAYARAMEHASDPADATFQQALYQRAKLRIEGEFEPERAIEMLDRYAELDPQGPMLPSAAAAWWRKGNALEQLGRIDEARVAYRESVRLDPEFERAQDALDELE